MFINIISNLLNLSLKIRKTYETINTEFRFINSGIVTDLQLDE